MWEPLVSRPESGCCPGTLLKAGVDGRAFSELCLLAQIKTYLFNLCTIVKATSEKSNESTLLVRKGAPKTCPRHNLRAEVSTILESAGLSLGVA